jgi:Predicted transcriptional regulators
MLNYNSSCPVEATLSVIGGKWKLLIYREIYMHGPQRFGELQRGVGKISAKVLTQQLRELETDGVLVRTIYPEIPPKVEYSFTDAGKSLEPVFLSMIDWGTAFLNGEFAFPKRISILPNEQRKAE